MGLLVCAHNKILRHQLAFGYSRLHRHLADAIRAERFSVFTSARGAPLNLRRIRYATRTGFGWGTNHTGVASLDLNCAASASASSFVGVKVVTDTDRIPLQLPQKQVT